jgi:hypothetical protein
MDRLTNIEGTLHKNTKKTRIIIGIIMLFVCVHKVYADTSEYVTISVGETRTLMLPPSISNLTLKDVVFTSGAPTQLKILYNTATTVTVEAIEKTSYYVPITCDFYYYTLQDGKWVWAHHSPFHFMVAIIGSGDGNENGPSHDGLWDSNNKCTITTDEGVKMTFIIIQESAKYCAPWGDGYDGTCIDKNTSGKLTIPSEVGGYRVYNTGYCAFSNCEKITGLILPASVVSTGDGSFYKCHGITSIDFIENIERIYVSAFMNCLGLVDIIIPNSVKYLDADCFSSCTNLKTVTIGENVEQIGIRAFGFCPNITSVTCLSKTPPSVHKNAFYLPELAILYVPKGSLNNYRNENVWKSFKEIIEFETTDIHDVLFDKSQKSSIYDINGRKLSQPSKGINIINGKVVLIK